MPSVTTFRVSASFFPLSPGLSSQENPCLALCVRADWRWEEAQAVQIPTETGLGAWMPDKLLQKAWLAATDRWAGVFLEFPRFLERVEASNSRPERLALEDLFLAAAIEDGNKNAWSTFYIIHYDFVKTVCARVLPEPDLVEDCAQEFCASFPTFVKRFRGLGSLRGWLGAVVPNYARNYLRRLKYTDSIDAAPADDPFAASRRDEMLSDHGSGAARTLDMMDLPECEQLFREILPKAMETLDPQWRILLTCKYYKGMTSREIASAVFRTKENNIAKWLPKALKQLNVRIVQLASKTARRGKEDLEHCIELIGK